MKCNLKISNPVRFDELRAGDVFIEKGYDTICMKIDTLCEDGDLDAIIEAIDLNNGRAWRIDDRDEVYKLNAELNAEYA